MLLTLGLGTQFTVLETVVTTIVDLWPQKLRGKNHKLLADSTVMFLLGLIICTNGGMYSHFGFHLGELPNQFRPLTYGDYT
ncbi:hypothetical protein OUZ56_019542 [Daphnia magna]|uniref:Uncharacterized protein n=1 Tax=Daphnia magna TaxID=35525 RepID=A0ABQ9ZBW1_9CRUS|nr:hypothetical protein OUZ56_019542 [Daphnia magna]